MKLYATVSSERATKGQGGKELMIEIMGENKVVIARIKVTSSYPYEYDMDIFPVVYPYPDKRCQSSCLKLDVKGHGYKLTRKVSKEEAKGTLDYSKLSTKTIEKELKELQAFLGEETSSTGRRDYLMEQAMIKELETRKGKREKGEPREGLCHCGYPCIYGTDYCERHQIP